MGLGCLRDAFVVELGLALLRYRLYGSQTGQELRHDQPF